MLVIKGNALWAKIFEPDTRYVPEGEFSVQVVVPETEAQEVCEQLENMAQAKLASCQGQSKTQDCPVHTYTV